MKYATILASAMLVATIAPLPVAEAQENGWVFVATVTGTATGPSTLVPLVGTQYDTVAFQYQMVDSRACNGNKVETILFNGLTITDGEGVRINDGRPVATWYAYGELMLGDWYISFDEVIGLQTVTFALTGETPVIGTFKHTFAGAGLGLVVHSELVNCADS